MASVPIVASALKTRLLVAAIDFGTTFSGYAYSFLSDFKTDPLKIHTQNWTTGSHSAHGMSLKTSTCVLFNEKREFHSFGFEAEDVYTALAVEDQHHEWYYFKQFKMYLYQNKDLRRETVLYDDKGNTMPAIEVFAAGIGYLKDKVIESISKRQTEITPNDIHWVLTVPAIWDDSAKQFMREAAVYAGIDTNHLSLALEPEAASLFCKYLPVEKIIGVDGAPKIASFAPGKKYLVLDAGGGTVDITVHETQEDGTVREIYKANGGPWGGVTIDEAFLKLLDDIAGRDTMEVFMNEYKEDHLSLVRDFELKKKTFGPELGDSKIQFRMPINIHVAYSVVNGQDFRQSFMMNQDLKGDVTFTGDKLRVKPKQVLDLFQTTCVEIINHLKDILSKPEVAGVEAILMVGGFSESNMLQHYVKSSFPNLFVIIPEEAGLAVLKGAVIFGHNPNAIISRRCKLTYGVKMYRTFEPGVHPPSKKVMRGGEAKCQGCFDVHVTTNEEVVLGQIFETHSYCPIVASAKAVGVKIYTSTKAKPLYVDEPECTFLGEIDVDLSHIRDNFKDKKILVHMKYGGTELGVEAKVVKTGEILKTTLNCLG
ncbi:hypothetical protein ACF0H5_010678 [Mactra antiquata]